MGQDSLEIRANVPDQSVLRRLISDVGSLLNYSQVESASELPEAQKCKTKFENMDLRTKYILYKELRRMAANAIGDGNLYRVKLYNERAQYLWENYIVVSRKI